MGHLFRRTGLALQGLSVAVPPSCAVRIGSESAPYSSPVPTQLELAAPNDNLLSYFSESAPKLLRPSQGVLRYPSISIEN
jgi:hypothetical protein